VIIYLDESGDLGFDFANKHPSQYFIITLLVCNNKTATDGFRTAVKRTLKNKLNHKKSNSREVDELHGTHLELSIKKYFYTQIRNDEWNIYSVALKKSGVYANLTSKKGRKKLYNFLSKFLVGKISFERVQSAVTLIVDKSKNKADIEDFNCYLANQLEALLPLNIPLNIYHEDSKANPGLQAVDCFCWGIFRKYERNDLEWYECYCDK